MHPQADSALPEAEQESIFRKLGRFGRWERLFRQYKRVLRATTKKVNFFGEEKCTPRQNRKSWLRLCDDVRKEPFNKTQELQKCHSGVEWR